MYFLGVSTKEELNCFCQIQWVVKDKLVLSLNNNFFMINLHQNELTSVKG